VASIAKVKDKMKHIIFIRPANVLASACISSDANIIAKQMSEVNNTSNIGMPIESALIGYTPACRFVRRTYFATKNVSEQAETASTNRTVKPTLVKVNLNLSWH
jgi:hypothetical protein